MDSEGNGESQQPSSSDVGQSLALRKMLEKEIEPMVLNIVRRVIEPMVINTVQEVIEPVTEVLLRKVVKEEIQSVEEKLLTGGTWNDMPKERSLQLKFLDEVSDTVQTGKEIKGINDECLELALFDATGHIVNCGPESSAKVEIILLDTSRNDDENNLTRENFERRIIRDGDKEKPHFPKSVYIYLEKGVGVLTGVKLGHDSGWTKNCNCRLGARIMQNFSGINVYEAWTAPFKVIDSRSTYYKKYDRPSPSSEFWRLKKIGRDGQPCRRLKDKNIRTVLDFLFWLSVNPKELQEEIVGAGDNKWQTTVTHAQTCIIDDKRMYSHKSSTEPQTAVVYDAMGKLKGLIDESHFVPIDNLSADKKDHAHKLLRSVLEPSTFVERYKTLFNDEASLLQQFPYRSLDTNVSSNSSIQKCLNGSDLTLGCQTIGPASSSQSITPSDIYDSGPSHSLGSKDTGELRNHALGPFPDPENIEGDTPTDLDDENHWFPTSRVLEKHKADDQELLASFNDMYHLQQQLSGSSKIVGESSSGRSNASFHSVSSTMNSFGESGGQWRCDDGDDWWDWGMLPPSPNPMLHYADDTQMYGHRNESRGDEGIAANTSTNPPSSWKRLSGLWFSFREKMSLDVARSCNKKRRVG